MAAVDPKPILDTITVSIDVPVFVAVLGVGSLADRTVKIADSATKAQLAAAMPQLYAAAGHVARLCDAIGGVDLNGEPEGPQTVGELRALEAEDGDDES
jgi:hypothetical protein